MLCFHTITVASFKEIPRIIAAEWKVIDPITKQYVEAVANVLKRRYAEIPDEMKTKASKRVAQSDKKKSGAKTGTSTEKKSSAKTPNSTEKEKASSMDQKPEQRKRKQHQKREAIVTSPIITASTRDIQAPPIPSNYLSSNDSITEVDLPDSDILDLYLNGEGSGSDKMC